MNDVPTIPRRSVRHLRLLLAELRSAADKILRPDEARVLHYLIRQLAAALGNDAVETLGANDKRRYLELSGATTSGVRDQQTKSPSLAARACGIIRSDCTAHLSVGDLATTLSCGRRTLERAFRREFGETIHEYMSRLRTEEALRLLMTTDMKTEAIAFQVGFRSRTSLQVHIRRATGLSPAAIREVANRALSIIAK